MDELCLEKGLDFQRLEALATERKSKGQCIWITIGKVKPSLQTASEWLSRQKTFFTPSLKYAMRNTKEIVKESKKYTQVFYTGDLSPASHKSKVAENVPSGRVISINKVHNSGDVHKILTEAFKEFQSERVLIVCPKLESINGLKKILKDIGRNDPLTVWDDQSSSGGLQQSNQDKHFKVCKDWLTNSNERQDMITHERFLSGFEWPSVMWINVLEDRSIRKIPSRDIVMRAVSTLVKVWLPQDAFEMYNFRY